MALKIYEVTKPIINRETNECTEPGTFIKMDPELAEIFITAGALKATNRKKLPNEENTVDGDSNS